MGKQAARRPQRSPVTAEHRRLARFILPLAWTGAGLFVAALGWSAFSYGVRFGRPAPAGPAVRPVFLNVCLFSAFALHHSLLARTRIKAAVQQWVPPPLERSLYTWVASLLFLAVCTLWQPVPGVLYHLQGFWAVAGYTVQAIGFLLTVRSAAAVDALDLAGVRHVLLARSGRHPAHTPLETSGVYGIVRHPLYLAWTLLVFGAPTMTGTRFVFAVVSTAYLALAIPLEERSLIGIFGDDYKRYRATVRWRMVPFLY